MQIMQYSNKNFIAYFIESLDIINHHGFAMMINNIKTSYKMLLLVNQY